MTEDDLPQDPAPTVPRRARRSLPPPGVPFSCDELQACLWRPTRALDIVLADRARLVANVRTATAIVALLVLLLLCSVLFAIPFAVIDGWRRLGDVALLFLGSALICFPALQVFGAYLSLRRSVTQNLVVALLIPAAAALFTLGFFPIYWFLDATMPAGASSTVTRIVLLTFSMLLALAHINRCLFLDEVLRQLRSSWWLWTGWQVLLVFITWRMANTLGMFS